jgi:alcohol dehydrogenase YqhD (iron-dependent ADH family)
MKYYINVPTKLHFGEGTLSKLNDEIKKDSTVMITYGGGSVKRSGLFDKVTAILKELNVTIVEFGGISPNPRVQEVRDGIKTAKENNVDMILAVGGGSVIDCSKAMIVGYYYDGDPWDLVKGKNQNQINKALPLGVVLTLSATGSECNSGAVITNLETNEKRGFGIAPYTFPTFSILDANHTVTVPKNHTTYGVVDILAHLFEIYFTANKDDDYVVDMTLSYIEVLIKNMMKIGSELVDNLEDVKLREGMLHIGTEALNTRLGAMAGGDWSSHSIEHSLSAYYDIPHGAGLAIVFPNWMKEVSKKRLDRLIRMSKNIFMIDTNNKSDDQIAAEGIEAFKSYLVSIGAPSTLTEENINFDKLDEMVEHSMWGETVGSYAPLNRDEVRNLLLNAK